MPSVKAALIAIMAWCAMSAIAHAVTVTDSYGDFTLNAKPERIVALEFSFVDALVAVDLSPVGIADDNEANRLLPEISAKLGKWQSVGTRSQPSLEVIAALKPDLIIADLDRHAAVYQELKKIAPTLILPSRRETYASNLHSAQVIADVVGRSAQMQQRISEHQALMNKYRQQLNANQLQHKVVQFGVARESNFYAHSTASYTGGVIEALGLHGAAELNNDSASREISFEQLLAINPDYLIVGDYVQHSVINEQWAKQKMWPMLTAVKQKQIYHVDGNLWARCRGLIAAEKMAKDIVSMFKLPHE